MKTRMWEAPIESALIRERHMLPPLRGKYHTAPEDLSPQQPPLAGALHGALNKNRTGLQGPIHYVYVRIHPHENGTV